MINKYII